MKKKNKNIKGIKMLPMFNFKICPSVSCIAATLPDLLVQIPDTEDFRLAIFLQEK